MKFALPSRFTYMSDLGSGAFGTCLKVYDDHLDKMVALKIVKPSLTNEPHNASILREIKIMTLIKDSGFNALTNIIRLEEVLISDDTTEIYLVEELMDTDLMHFLDESHHKLSFSEKLYILQQVINGLLVLHKFNIIHRDLKPHNILINKKNLKVKIADFGLSRYYHSCLPNANSQSTIFPIDQDSPIFRQLQETVVTLPYRAPELLMYPNYSWKLISKKIDSWSLGLIAMHIFYHEQITNFETSLTFPDINNKPKDMDDSFYVINHWCQTFGLLPLKHPFLFELMDQQAKLENQKHFMQNNYKKSRFDSFIKQSLGDDKDTLGDLIKQLLNLDPTKRISIENLIIHPYVYFNSFKYDSHATPKAHQYNHGFKFSFTADRIYQSDMDFDNCDEYFGFEDIDHENKEKKIYNILLNSCFKISSGLSKYFIPCSIISTTSTFAKEYLRTPQKIHSLLELQSDINESLRLVDCQDFQKLPYIGTNSTPKRTANSVLQETNFSFEERNINNKNNGIYDDRNENELFERISLNSSRSSIHHGYSFIEK